MIQQTVCKFQVVASMKNGTSTFHKGRIPTLCLQNPEKIKCKLFEEKSLNPIKVYLFSIGF